MILKEKYWHEFFEAGVTIKAINGLWETISGAVLLFISKAAINNSFIALTQKELTEDPQDKFIYFLNQQLQHLSSSTKNFAGFYILAHGVVNLFLAYNLYRNRLWSYLVSIIFALLFLSYLIYRASHTHSFVLVGIIIYDILFTIITWHEYKYLTGELKR